MEPQRPAVCMWDKNAKAEGPLRRPNTNLSTAQTGINEQEIVEGLENKLRLASNSTLSVDAKEWFPASYNQKSDLNCELEYDTKGKSQLGDTVLYNNKSQSNYDRLEQIMTVLSKNPEKFDILVEEFLEILCEYNDDLPMISRVTEMIINCAIQDSNIRWNAARLSAKIAEHCSLFLATLQMDSEKKLKESPCSQGFAFFLSELFMQFNQDSIFGENVFNILNNLIDDGRPENVKCVCQALKLVGHSLDSFDSVSLGKLIEKLRLIQNSLSNSTVSALIDSVVALGTSSWGKSQNVQNATPTSFSNRDDQDDLNQWQLQEEHESVLDDEDDIIFYGPDGVELTVEERKFLAENLNDGIDTISDDSDPAAVWDPDPELNEEVKAAFLQFVNANK